MRKERRGSGKGDIWRKRESVGKWSRNILLLNKRKVRE